MEFLHTESKNLWPSETCWDGKGTCKLVCTNDEVFFQRCENHKKCCLSPEVETVPPVIIDYILLYPSSFPPTDD
uniref:Beta-defensin n=1 Tax=Monodelphis domestica TaxID=13616 RepID=A0A5F8GM74_MONDO